MRGSGNRRYFYGLILLQAALIAGCGSATVSNMTTGTVTGTGNPLVAQYSITSSKDASVTVEFGPDMNYGFQTSSQSTPPGGGQVNILVAGMKQNTTYHVYAGLSFADGTQMFDVDHTFTTGGLPPARVPVVSVTEPAGLTPSPGIELAMFVNASTTHRVQAVAFNNIGQLIWYYDYDPSLGFPFPIQLMPSGNMLVVLDILYSGIPTVVREIDLSGKTITEFNVNDLNKWLNEAGFSLVTSEIHHDAIPLPSGHIILIVATSKTFTDLPGFPGETNVMGDGIVDLDENLKPVWVWNTFDHLDVNRHPVLFPDWTHSNALVYLPDDGNLLLSMRHQSWIIKIDYENGKGSADVLWRLGYQGDFTLNSGSLS